MDYYQLFAGCMLDVEFLEPAGKHAKWITDYLESDNRLFCGLPRFRRDAGPGGIDALYGKGYLLDQLRVGAVREFLVGFYAFLAFNMDHTTFTSRETNVIYSSDRQCGRPIMCPINRIPFPARVPWRCSWCGTCWPPSCRRSVEEVPDTLLLLAGVPQHWLAPGQSTAFHGPAHGLRTGVAERSGAQRTRALRFRLTPPVRRPPQNDPHPTRSSRIADRQVVEFDGNRPNALTHRLLDRVTGRLAAG